MHHRVLSLVLGVVKSHLLLAPDGLDVPLEVTQEESYVVDTKYFLKYVFFVL